MSARKPAKSKTPSGDESRSRSLSLQRILAVTAEVAEAEGFAGVSMRVIAQRLDVTATALYRHVSDKNDLLDQLAEKLVRDVTKLDHARPWDQRLRHFVLGMQKAFLRFPGLNQHLATRGERGAGQLWAETLLEIFIDAGFDDRGICEAFEQFVYFINPLTLVDSAPATPRGPGGNIMATIEHLRQSRPGLARALSAEPLMPSPKSYARALDRLIASVAANLPRKTR
ncbi:MAG: TetR/AcrR family transcriptional regulator [Bradyrhizobium sp.]